MLPIALAAAVLSALLAFPAWVVASGFAARALAEGTRLPDPPPGVPPDRRLGAALRLAWREWGSTLRVLLTWPLGIGPGRTPEFSPADGARPVLVLPGYGLTRASVWPLQRWLEGQGVDICSWTPPLLAPPRRAATRLAERLRALSANSLDRPVDVVAFGASGLLVAEALAADPDCPVGRLIGLGTPWRGAPSSVYLPGPGAAALLPDRPEVTYWNDVLRASLDAPMTVEGARLPDGRPRRVAIRSSDDLWVPTRSATPPRGGADVVLHGAGHQHLLHHPDAHRAVLKALRPDAGTGEGS